MKMRIKQRAFSWLGKFDVTDDVGNTLFTVEGKLGWGRCFNIYDQSQVCVATLKKVVWSFMPRFEMYLGDTFFGIVKKEFTFLKPCFSLDANGWQVQGNWLEWDYNITDSYGRTVAVISTELFNFTDTYVIQTERSEDALKVLMIVIGIDVEKEERD